MCNTLSYVRVSNVIPSLWSAQNNVHNHHLFISSSSSAIINISMDCKTSQKRKLKIHVAALNNSYHLKYYVDEPSKPKHFTKLGSCCNTTRVQDTRSVTATTSNHSYCVIHYSHFNDKSIYKPIHHPPIKSSHEGPEDCNEHLW